jgi:P-aminobenzoate N-oxygenase AurF
MNAMLDTSDTSRYARCIDASKRVRWDIEADVIRGRDFDAGEKYLPDGLSLAREFTSLSDDERRFVSRIQGRTYANIFGLVERYINAKILELSQHYWMGDQIALEALVRFSDEELKHQALFRRVEKMIGETLPDGYRFDVNADDVARVVLGKSSWAVLALTLHIELFTQLHYRQSIEPDKHLSPLFKDIFLFHWKEESQHAILDEMEFRRCDAALSPEERDRAVDEFIELVAAVDGILQAQAASDTQYFAKRCGRVVGRDEAILIEATFLKAYRWQYIHSGAAHPAFTKVLGEVVTEDQGGRIAAALATLRNS